MVTKRENDCSLKHKLKQLSSTLKRNVSWAADQHIKMTLKGIFCLFFKEYYGVNGTRNCLLTDILLIIF